jgi:hypothetical protein
MRRVEPFACIFFAARQPACQRRLCDLFSLDRKRTKTKKTIARNIQMAPDK